MLRSILVISIALAILGCPAPLHAQPKKAEPPEQLFDLRGSPIQQIIVTKQEALDRAVLEGSPMLSRLAGGVLGTLPPNQISQLRACVPKDSLAIGPPPGAVRQCVIHLVGAEGRKRSIAIERTPEGILCGAVLDAARERPLRHELDRTKIEPLLLSWSVFTGSFQAAPDSPPGELAQLAKPYVPGLFVFDKPTMSRRVYAGGSWTQAAMSRTLDASTFHIRLPRGYDPKSPAGLLVWIDAGNYGGPPDVFNETLDELGIIAVGAANSGNTVPVVDRFQLAFDAMATVHSRYHVDARRIYVSGISGGGRLASILIGCFPDVFAGAVPIVGMDCYKDTPTGVGQFWRRGYERPDSKLWSQLTQRRIAAMTGPKDGNYRKIAHGAEIMKRDGLKVRVFEYVDMGHTLPTAERFREAMTWVDEPYRQVREKETQSAATLFQQLTSKSGREPDAKQLARVTEIGPWTKAAWQAVDLLQKNGKFKIAKPAADNERVEEPSTDSAPSPAASPETPAHPK